MGKEYNSDGEEIFEGKYSNGKRLKKSNKFWIKLLFEGEYLYGKRNGKGKEYNYDGNGGIFEGEFINNKITGKGKEYNSHNEMTFDGEYLYDYKIKGKEYYKGRLIYEGEYSFGKRSKGKEYDDGGKIRNKMPNGLSNLDENQLFQAFSDRMNEEFDRIDNAKKKKCWIF